MNIPPYISISFLAICFIMTYFFVKKTKQKGYISYGYFFLLVFSINLFTFFSLTFLYSTTQELYRSIFYGQNYTATVVDIIEEEKYDDEEDRYYTMQTPVVFFTTNAGKFVEKTLDFSTTDIRLGDEYKVNYNESDNSIITLGFTQVLKVVSALLFSSIFILLFSGLVNYIIGFKMDLFYTIASIVGWYFLLPFIMICFDALLIYALFNGNEVPFFVTALLYFFIFVLSLSILSYLKMLFTKGTPIMQRTGDGSWSADW